MPSLTITGYSIYNNNDYPIYINYYDDYLATFDTIAPGGSFGSNLKDNSVLVSTGGTSTSILKESFCQIQGDSNYYYLSGVDEGVYVEYKAYPGTPLTVDFDSSSDYNVSINCSTNNGLITKVKDTVTGNELLPPFPKTLVPNVNEEGEIYLEIEATAPTITINTTNTATPVVTPT